MPKRLASLALVVGLAIVAAGCGGGGSSDSSSGWSASDVAQTENKIADTLTAEGVTATKAETECIRKGLEPLASPSEVLGNAEPSSQQREEIEELTITCLGGEQTASDEGEETSGDGAEEVGTEGSEDGEVNPGLQEMDDELQQEYEEEGVTP